MHSLGAPLPPGVGGNPNPLPPGIQSPPGAQDGSSKVVPAKNSPRSPKKHDDDRAKSKQRRGERQRRHHACNPRFLKPVSHQTATAAMQAISRSFARPPNSITHTPDVLFVVLDTVRADALTPQGGACRGCDPSTAEAGQPSSGGRSLSRQFEPRPDSSRRPS